MDAIRKKEELIKDLHDKEIRDSFVLDHINVGIPLQIRTLRMQAGREWTQKELAERAGMKQERISAIENPNYKNAFTLSTLVRLASSFDVALIVRFAPISELVKWELTLSPEKLEAVAFEEDPYLKETTQQEYAMTYLQPEPHRYNHIGSGGLTLGGEGIIKFLNPSQPVPSLQPTQPRQQPHDELAKLRKARQKESKNQLQKFMAGMGEGNETAFG